MFQFINTTLGRKLNNWRSLCLIIASLLLIIFFAGYVPQSSASSTLAAQPLPETIRFAAIGDYGVSDARELAVANLVRSWNPDFIITLGDNNYPNGAASTIDMRIGQYYHDYISPYSGSYVPGSTTNRFFPALGNHDWIASGALPYLNYFSLPNNERYYTFIQGPVEFFVMDSDSHEPDGISVTSVQAAWLHQQLIASSATWKIVYFHHPPYSSGATHGSTTALQWPFQQWGVSAVLSGHEHNYERILHDGIPYIVNGLGGNTVYPFGTAVAGSEMRYNAANGAQLIEASTDHLTFQFYSVVNGSTLVDTYTINALAGAATATPTETSTSNPNDTPTSTLEFTPTPTLTPTLTATSTPTLTPTLTATLTPVAPLTLNAVADAYVSNGSRNSNFGTSTTMRTDASPIQRSYLRFTVPPLSGSITSAKLQIYANTASKNGYTVHSSTGTWNELTINFSNAPAIGKNIGSSGAITANKWTQVDVTSVVKDAGQYTFVIDTTNSTATSFSSREGANPPQLIISIANNVLASAATYTPSFTLTPTIPATLTPTETLTLTSTLTLVPTGTATEMPTLTFTPTLTATLTPTETLTLTSTLTPLPTGTATDIPTLTFTPTLTATLTPTETLTLTPTLTPLPTGTATDIPTLTFTPTDIP